MDEALRGDREFVLNALQRNAEVQMGALFDKRMLIYLAAQVLPYVVDYLREAGHVPVY